jgi:hypothetical protein
MPLFLAVWCPSAEVGPSLGLQWGIELKKIDDIIFTNPGSLCLYLAPPPLPPSGNTPDQIPGRMPLSRKIVEVWEWRLQAANRGGSTKTF